MLKLYDGGAYLVNGTEIITDEAEVKAKTGREVSKEEARTQTMAYGILDAHNTSGNMERLQIKFDKLTSHDITFVGIIQTARASGLEKFPIPYVLTNCHNSLCAVGVDLCLWHGLRHVRPLKADSDTIRVAAFGMSSHCPLWPESVDGSILADQEVIACTGPSILFVPAVNVFCSTLRSFRMMQYCSLG